MPNGFDFETGQRPFGTPTGPAPATRSQLQYPLDPQSEGALKLALENVLKDVIIRRNRIQFTIPSGATSFDVASSYMVLTGAAAVTIATIKGGREGMTLTLQFTDANVTITDTATGAADTVNLSAAFTSTANDVLQLLHDGISWREVGRGTSVAASTSVSGVVELATDAETHTGTDTSRAVTPSNITSIIKRVYKSAEETVNNSDVLQDDNHLLFAVGANEAWAFNMVLYMNSGTTPDIKLQINVPSGATGFYDSPTGVPSAMTAFGSPQTQSTSGSDQQMFFTGTVINGATPGNLQLQWAQNLATLSDTKILKGSCIIAYRLA